MHGWIKGRTSDTESTLDSSIYLIYSLIFLVVFKPAFCRSERANANYTTNFIRKLLTEEGQKSFATRTSILGR